MKKKMFVRILIDIIVIIFVLTIIFGIRALKPTRIPITINPGDLGLPYEKIFLKTSDGKKLSGWLILSEKSDAIIICLHGYPANKSDILPVVSFLYPDFSLLLFDFRAHGESEGKITYFGLKEYMDVESGIKFIKENEKTKKMKIGIWGYSFGAAVGILSATYNEIGALVSDSSFANFPEMITHYYKNFGPLKYIFSFFSKILGKYIIGIDFTLNSPEYTIDKIKCPILIIHSEEDEFVPVEHAKRLFEKAKSEKELYLVKGPHTGLDRAYTTQYQQKVKGFFKKYLTK